MFSGVPNLALTVGYINASWTLRADLVSRHVVRLLTHMEEAGFDVVVPGRPPVHGGTRPLLDLDAGYVSRSLDQLPKQGTDDPWVVHRTYGRDRRAFRSAALEDDGLEFRRVGVAATDGPRAG